MLLDLKRIGETGWLRGFAMCEHENTAHLRLASLWENCNELR